MRKPDLLTDTIIRREVAWLTRKFLETAGVNKPISEVERLVSAPVAELEFSIEEWQGSLDDLSAGRLSAVAWEQAVPLIDPCVLMYWAS